MTIVYGGCIEPEGYELLNERYLDDCPRCKSPRCLYHNFENADGGSVNRYYEISCEDCGYRDEDLPDSWDAYFEDDRNWDEEQSDDDFDADEAGDDPCDE